MPTRRTSSQSKVRPDYKKSILTSVIAAVISFLIALISYIMTSDVRLSVTLFIILIALVLVGAIKSLLLERRVERNMK